MNNSDLVLTHGFSKPIHRLIMLCILLDGTADGEGERIISHARFAEFCCCSPQALFRELKVLEAQAFIVMRKIASVTHDGKLITHPERGYTITGSVQQWQ